MKYLYNYLKFHNYKLSTCESFTGGLFAHQFSNITGASQFLTGGYVCYSNDFKIKQVNVSEQIIKNYSEVSQETLTALLSNTQKQLNSTVCFAFTGYATPFNPTNARSGQSFVGFCINEEYYCYEFLGRKSWSRARYKTAAIKFVLKKFKMVTKND